MRCKFLEQKTNFKTSSSKQYIDSLCTKAKFGGLPSWHLISSTSREGERRLTNFGDSDAALATRQRRRRTRKGSLHRPAAVALDVTFFDLLKELSRPGCTSFWKEVLCFDTPLLGFFSPDALNLKRKPFLLRHPPKKNYAWLI